ncbi:MAG: hypothetical protein JWP46_433 [Modestobacter sp.]|nr:hypothetical protein [Modestobacter sp.]
MTIDQQTAVQDLPAGVDERRRAANAETLARLTGAEPVLVDVAPAGDVVPGMTPTTILTSGAPLEWAEYTGGQRRAVLYAVLYEGLAADLPDAEQAILAGRIQVRSTQQHACIGSVAGIYTASMPVLVVRDETHGNTAFCNLYEGESRHRLNYGSYNDEVVSGLRWLEDTMGPLLAECLRHGGPIRLKPLMARALRLGDELHSRNTAATLLLTRELTPAFLDLDRTGSSVAVREVFEFLSRNEYAFLRVGMAAAKATADAAHGVPYSSVLTGMALNSREFAVRVSGLGDEWFRGAHPRLEGRFFDGFTEADAQWIGGESCVTETIGLGGFAQVCAPTLQAYQGGTTEAMRANNEAMYAITVGEHPDFRLPPLDFRGSPVGIDVFAVLATGIAPVIDGGLAGKDGGQIGAGVLRPGLDCFHEAARAYRQRYAEG